MPRNNQRPFPHRFLTDDLWCTGRLIDNVVGQVSHQRIDIIAIDCSDLGSVGSLLDRGCVLRMCAGHSGKNDRTGK